MSTISRTITPCSDLTQAAGGQCAPPRALPDPPLSPADRSQGQSRWEQDDDAHSSSVITANAKTGERSMENGINHMDNVLIKDDLLVTWKPQENSAHPMSGEHKICTMLTLALIPLFSK